MIQELFELNFPFNYKLIQKWDSNEKCIFFLILQVIAQYFKLNVHFSFDLINQWNGIFGQSGNHQLINIYILIISLILWKILLHLRIIFMTFVAFMTFNSSNLRPELTCAHTKSSKKGVFVIKLSKTTQRFFYEKYCIYLFIH
jgi:hypothetical protein